MVASVRMSRGGAGMMMLMVMKMMIVRRGSRLLVVPHHHGRLHQGWAPSNVVLRGLWAGGAHRAGGAARVLAVGTAASLLPRGVSWRLMLMLMLVVILVVELLVRRPAEGVAIQRVRPTWRCEGSSRGCHEGCQGLRHVRMGLVVPMGGRWMKPCSLAAAVAVPFPQHLEDHAEAADLALLQGLAGLPLKLGSALHRPPVHRDDLVAREEANLRRFRICHCRHHQLRHHEAQLAVAAMTDAMGEFDPHEFMLHRRHWVPHHRTAAMQALIEALVPQELVVEGTRTMLQWLALQGPMLLVLLGIGLRHVLVEARSHCSFADVPGAGGAGAVGRRPLRVLRPIPANSYQETAFRCCILRDVEVAAQAPSLHR
mmetsp:Transcript_57700/g.122766  ORF Transcript_57700/g.122766 Transcript_57700/m.122766 type:complete len:370 (+) Transcript_57700:384-1493(+)